MGKIHGNSARVTSLSRSRSGPRRIARSGCRAFPWSANISVAIVTPLILPFSRFLLRLDPRWRPVSRTNGTKLDKEKYAAEDRGAVSDSIISREPSQFLPINLRRGEADRSLPTPAVVTLFRCRRDNRLRRYEPRSLVVRRISECNRRTPDEDLSRGTRSASA